MSYRQHPQIIFANIVNELMAVAPSPAYIKAMSVVTPRKIWLAREGDVIVTSRPFEEPHKRYACSILGIDPDKVVTLSPGGEYTDSLSRQVLQGDLLGRLRDLIAERPGIDILPFAIDRPTLELVEALGVPLHWYRELPGPRLREVLYELNTKSGFRRAAESLGLRVVPGARCEGLEELKKTVEELLPLTGGVVIKLDRSSNGFSHIILRRDELSGQDLRATLAQRLDSTLTPQQPRVFTVEALMKFVNVPSVELVVEEEGADVLYVCDMRTVNNMFTGMVTPPINLTPRTENELLIVGKVFGDYVHGLGFRGICDVDAGVTEDGTLYVGETNFRRTGGTYLDALVKRLVGDNYLETHVWWADGRVGQGVRDFAGGLSALCDSGLAYDAERREGVILTANTVEIDGKWRYLIIAPSHERAAEMESKLEDLFQLQRLA
jgi:hypothetical protein